MRTVMQTAKSAILLAAPLALVGCFSDDPAGLAPAPAAQTTVRMDFEHRPLPEIPLPNDIATRYDPTSATGRRINASMIAPTGLEMDIRARLDRLDGWGLIQPISIPFTGPIDVQSILDRHRDADYDPEDDAIYLVDITPSSPDFGKIQHLDIGNGNYPSLTESRDAYWPHDPRSGTLSILWEEYDEDTNGNGVLDPGEDTDADGVLDVPNYLPGADPAWDDLGARADALMTFYEKQTNTLIVQPLVPLRERTTYALIVTRRLLDESGQPVGSPYPFINHEGQTEALEPLKQVLPAGLRLDDIAFTFSFTTQTTTAEFIAVRDGLYGHGVQKVLGETFPAELDTVHPAVEPDRVNTDNVHILRGEQFEAALRLVSSQLRDASEGSVFFDQIIEGNRYVDYYVIGTYQSPQLYDRVDANGDKLPVNAQSWPDDLHSIPVEGARPETVWFTLVVPRKEVSVRGEGKPAPVVILGHGHTGNRFDAMNLGPYMARHGLATLAIDNPGHGLNLSPDEELLATTLLGQFGVGPFIDASFSDRSIDHNYDGVTDSGADYWDFYLFHTRDNVRQTALDYMQLIRILRNFDGERSWAFDLNADGTNELAGDFDADGVIDVGGEAPIRMSGGSLGGIMAMLMGSIEPEIDAIAPIVGGGGLGTIARRSINSSVRRAVLLRSFGPMILGTTDADGSTRIEHFVPNINERGVPLHVSTISGVSPGDTMRVINQANGEMECGRVNSEGGVRAPIATDIGDPLTVEFYKGDVQEDDHCHIASGETPYATVDTFEDAVTFQNLMAEAGDPLTAMAEGLGLRRATPDLRRFVGLGQIVMDRADPANYARHMLMEPLTYPGTGQTTGAHALVTTGIGDLNVPVDAGQLFSRAAGILEYLEPHPDWGIPVNQVLIDHYVMEGAEEMMRFTNPDGQGVVIDPNDFSGDTDYWAGRTVRLDPPLRDGFDTPDPLGGRSANIFAYGSDRGKHGFDNPGVMMDDARDRCRDTCETEDCGCADLVIFDVGNFHLNQIGDYLKNGGQSISTDLCNSRYDCPDMPPAPEARTF